MLAIVQGYGLMGIEGYPVEVQVDVSAGMPQTDIVGLPDAAVKESRDRVRAAIKNCGFQYPMMRVTVNLSPADVKKEGPIYDLPIAVGILAATRQVPFSILNGTLYIGELSLDGRIKHVVGVLPMCLSALKGNIRSVVLSEQDAAEASCVEGLTVYGAKTLGEIAAGAKGIAPLQKVEPVAWAPGNYQDVSGDFSEIRGQQQAKRAVEIAVSGGHNILLIGTPGSGKTMLARALPGIMPELTFEEAVEITRVHSLMGELPPGIGLVRLRPFRAPHHGASAAALTGGGAHALPGEVSLAHHGVLFLDEFPEFSRTALETLRQPMEDGLVRIVRVGARAEYPAQFMLVAAMNPCPCGNFGSRERECRCTPLEIRRYLSKISGPMIDRFDLHVQVDQLPYAQLQKEEEAESSAAIRNRVERARAGQRARNTQPGMRLNARLTGSALRKACRMDEAARNMLERIYTARKLSARAHDKILRVSRTIADMEEAERVEAQHIAEAVQYRAWDHLAQGQ